MDDSSPPAASPPEREAQPEAVESKDAQPQEAQAQVAHPAQPEPRKEDEGKAAEKAADKAADKPKEHPKRDASAEEPAKKPKQPETDSQRRQRQSDEEVLRRLESYPRHDNILNQPFKLLSSVQRAPTATFIGKGHVKESVIKPGPGSYELGLSWTKKGAPRMVPPTTHSLKPPPVDTLTELEYKSPRGNGFSFGFRHSEGNSREQKPGPTAYSLPSFTDKIEKRSDKCTFGVPHPPEKPNPNPGPGTYESTPTKVSPRVFRKTARVRAVPKPPPAKPLPGPGEYAIPSTFAPQHGSLVPTIKGRLEHPFFDHMAVHECAKTSSPRSFQKRMRAVPRLK